MAKIVREFNNYLNTIGDLASEAEEWTSRPSWLEYARNNVCNLRCIMCGQADGVPLVTMERDEAEDLLADILPHASLWTPSALSEPLLADFRHVLAECRKHDVFLHMYTNATLTDGKALRDMADRVHKLYVSFDSHVPEVFERLRYPAKFDKVRANAKEILQVAAELALPIGFVVVLMPDTLRTLPEYIDFVADMGGADARVEVRVQPMLDNASGCEGLQLDAELSDEEICSYLDRASERAVARNIILRIEGRAPFYRIVAPVSPVMRGVPADVLNLLFDNIKENHPHFCTMAATYSKIEPSGDVYPCCIGPEELNMGNVKETSFEEIWNGPKYRELRRRMHARDYPDVCRTCGHLVDNPHFVEKVGLSTVSESS